MLRRPSSFIAALVALVLAAPVAASTITPVTLDYIGQATDPRSVRIEEAPVPIASGGPPSDMYASALQMQDTSGPLGSFIAWSIDISRALSGTGLNYSVTPHWLFSSVALDGARHARVQRYFDANYYLGIETVRNRAAAFQIGLWEVFYDDDFSLTNDTPSLNDEFRGYISHTTTRTRAEQYLAAASTYSGQQKWFLDYLESRAATSNLVTATAVPAPAALLSLMTALAGFAALRRRSRQSA